MKGNREIDDLLLSYILKELNAEDEAFVQEYIRSNESNQRHYEEIRNTWKAILIKKGLERVNADEEWDSFEQRVQKEKQQLVVIKTDRKAEEEDQAGPMEERGSRRRVFGPFAVAAAVLSMVIAGWMLFRPRDKQAAIAGLATPSKEKPLSHVKRLINTTGRPDTLLLPDGSEVVLTDKSEISYAEPFSNNRRDIKLKGKAEFKVVQDKSMPFTVYSMGLATTALGTDFTVSAFDQEENIIIRLNEGKVVVKAAEQAKEGLKKDYYLLPGQSLVYNNKKYTVRLLDAEKKKSRLAAGTKGEDLAYTDLPDLPENNRGSWYMFNNESLADVFDQLRLQFNTEIVYEKKDMHNLYFAGKFDKSDSLSTILQQIASVNKLKVTKRNNKYIITK
ncbi:MAG: DUF4974 domain-containing protein [Bacteroidetes bacterium]|nr:DUF4974 domain-containing protein [Bacteroidota bacterium]